MYSLKADHFIARCLAGSVIPGDIDDDVQRWHESASPQELHEFLGMSAEEYGLWLRDPEALRFILTARRQRLPLARVVREDLRERERATESAADADLRKWLERRGEVEPADPK